MGKTFQQVKPNNPVENKSTRWLQAGHPKQVFFINIVDPLTPSPRGNTSILRLSRWRDALPFPDSTAKIITKLLNEQVFCYRVVPKANLYWQEGKV